MYMPATVGVTQGAQYGEVEMGKLATAVANLYKQGAYGGVFNKEFAKKVFDEAGKGCYFGRCRNSTKKELQI